LHTENCYICIFCVIFVLYLESFIRPKPLHNCAHQHRARQHRARARQHRAHTHTHTHARTHARTHAHTHTNIVHLTPTSVHHCWNKKDLMGRQHCVTHVSARRCTCDVKLQLHGDLVGEGGVAEQLVSLLQGALLRGDAVDGQQPVPHLHQPTPEGNKHTETRITEGCWFRSPGSSPS